MLSQPTDSAKALVHLFGRSPDAMRAYGKFMDAFHLAKEGHPSGDQVGAPDDLDGHYTEESLAEEEPSRDSGVSASSMQLWAPTPLTSDPAAQLALEAAPEGGLALPDDLQAIDEEATVWEANMLARFLADGKRAADSWVELFFGALRYLKDAFPPDCSPEERCIAAVPFRVNVALGSSAVQQQCLMADVTPSTVYAAHPAYIGRPASRPAAAQQEAATKLAVDAPMASGAPGDDAAQQRALVEADAAAAT